MHLGSAINAVDSLIEVHFARIQGNRNIRFLMAPTAKFLVVAFLAIVSTATALAVDAQKTFLHSIAKFSFAIPSAAKIKKMDDGIAGGTVKDSITIEWKHGELGVRVLNMPLERALTITEALAKDEKGQWYRPGRADARGKTQNFKSGKLSGLYGVSMCGVSDNMGFHGAGGECLSGFLTDGKRTAYFETDGLFPVDTVVKVIMPSFKFTQ